MLYRLDLTWLFITRVLISKLNWIVSFNFRWVFDCASNNILILCKYFSLFPILFLVFLVLKLFFSDNVIFDFLFKKNVFLSLSFLLLLNSQLLFLHLLFQDFWITLLLFLPVLSLLWRFKDCYLRGRFLRRPLRIYSAIVYALVKSRCLSWWFLFLSLRHSKSWRGKIWVKPLSHLRGGPSWVRWRFIILFLWRICRWHHRLSTIRVGVPWRRSYTWIVETSSIVVIWRGLIHLVLSWEAHWRRHLRWGGLIVSEFHFLLLVQTVIIKFSLKTFMAASNFVMLSNPNTKCLTSYYDRRSGKFWYLTWKTCLLRSISLLSVWLAHSTSATWVSSHQKAHFSSYWVCADQSSTWLLAQTATIESLSGSAWSTFLIASQLQQPKTCSTGRSLMDARLLSTGTSESDLEDSSAEERLQDAKSEMRSDLLKKMPMTKTDLSPPKTRSKNSQLPDLHALSRSKSQNSTNKMNSWLTLLTLREWGLRKSPRKIFGARRIFRSWQCSSLLSLNLNSLTRALSDKNRLLLN